MEKCYIDEKIVETLLLRSQAVLNIVEVLDTTVFLY